MKKIFTLLLVASLCSISFAKSTNDERVLVGEVFYLFDGIEQGYILDSCAWNKHDNVYVPDSIAYLDVNYPVIAIDDSAFYQAEDFDSVFIPTTIKEINAGAFQKSGVCYINITDSIEYIEEYAFAECPNLKTVYFPKGITEIEKCTFAESNNFESFEIPETVIVIDTAAFFECGLTTITIPVAVEEINHLAFNGCIDLKSIRVKATVPPVVETEAFEGVDHSIPVIVPVGTLDAYKTAEGWKEFTNLTDNQETAVQEVSSVPAFTIENGKIIADGPVTIYNLAGQDVTAQNGQLQGTYILVQDEKAVKVIIHN